MAQQADDTAQVRELVESWARAVRDRDLDGILAHHSPDLVFYDVPEPGRFRGLDAYRRSWGEEFFPWFGDSGLFELDELEVTAGPETAFCHCVVRCAGSGPDADPAEQLDVRLTMGLARRGGQWSVVHEHHSVAAD
ncbi:nuclear transport factor 2 family protein [Saccharopolyspora erythraea]|uniref:YybH family protein n=1 Tax=Saccharopolyspora erythraea TaxID=1836 RepID=UPI001BAB90DC|nr:nuclear transport factor 2 family protein [Saccharopolyspora erythraea]QUH02808.1 nuclear transport factor 2 family protein [Saccharopolyspora erythraea]